MDFADLFGTRLAQNPNFRIAVSLLARSAAAAEGAAASLDLSRDELDREIMEMLGILLKLKTSLPAGQRERLDVRVHESLPRVPDACRAFVRLTSGSSCRDRGRRNSVE